MDPLSTINFPHAVYKVHVDGHSGKLFIECKDAEKRKGLLYEIESFKSNKLLEPLEFKFETKVLSVWNQHVVVTKYPHLSTPKTKGVFVIDFKSGDIIWGNSSWHFIKLEGDVLFLTDEFGIEKMLEVSTGNPVQNVLELGSIKVYHPVVFATGDELYEKLFRLLVKYSSILPIGEILFLECATKIIIQCQYRKDDIFWLCLICMDERGNILLKNEVQIGSVSISLPSFFVLEQYLVHLNNKNTISVYELE